MPLRPPVRNNVALGGQGSGPQSLVPTRSPFGLMVFVNRTQATLQAQVPGGSYMNGA